MATKIKLIGRTTDFKGKPLWEIVGNLKNFGVGRIVARNMFQRYPESSYMKIVKVDAVPQPKEGDRKVRVWVERTFRGRTSPNSVEIFSASYKADYILIPKSEESIFCKPLETIEERILPQFIEFPPLLKQFIVKETGNLEPLLKVRIKVNQLKIARIAKDGEAPTIGLTMALGKPCSPRLYQNLNV